MKTRQPTMKDVAREAGVALGTVSKVFNGHAVGESYRFKVESAAKRLGYQVNEYARGLRSGKTYTVALILPEVRNPFFAALAQQIYISLARRGYRMLLYVTATHPNMEQDCINMVRQNKVDGIIGLMHTAVRVDGELPFVSIDCSLHPDIPCVTSDNYGGGRIAAERLIELGCRHLAFLHLGSACASEADRRGDGFINTCQAKGITCDALCLDDDDASGRLQRFFLSHMANGKLDIDGIFSSTDFLACRTKRLLAELGVRVPEDVQIIGFNGIQKFDTAAPYCSTIVQPVEKIAEACVDLLLTEDRSKAPALVCLPVSYLPGGTTRE